MFFYDARDRQVTKDGKANSTISDIVVKVLYKGEDHSEAVEDDQEGFDLQMFESLFDNFSML